MKSKTKIISKPNKAIKELEAINERMKGPDVVKVGLPKGSNDYPDGTSVIMVGTVHEFGSPARNIPQRSYLRSTMNNKKVDYKKLFKKLSKSIVNGKSNKEKALNIVGLQVMADVKDKIRTLKSPPLKYREGNPLIDTAHLVQSIVYKVGD